jgi:cytochrome c peroxidase
MGTEVRKVFKPLPLSFNRPEKPPTPAQIALGKKLYFEKRLSLSQNISCHTCHPLGRYGADGKSFSPGHGGKLGGRNAPTVLNSAGHVAQFWDGRSPTVEDQALGPMTNPVEMAMPSAEAVVQRLKGIPEYQRDFAKAYPESGEPVTAAHVGGAIGAFERQLVTPGKWDRYLAGDTKALGAMEKRGLATFTDFACQACHQGALLGGDRFEKLGVLKAWPHTNDLGRFSLTHQEEDRLAFKVPSLRNIEKTGPYFHDGSVSDLSTAVTLMARHQVGRNPSARETKWLVSFLKSLTGHLPPGLADEKVL